RRRGDGAHAPAPARPRGRERPGVAQRAGHVPRAAVGRPGAARRSGRRRRPARAVADHSVQRRPRRLHTQARRRAEPQRRLRLAVLAAEEEHQRPLEGLHAGARPRLRPPLERPLLLEAGPPHHPGSRLGPPIPATTISARHSKNNTRLLFSTQRHAFDDEKSSTRVGSKVPVQTASVYNGLTAATNGQNNNGTGAVASNLFGGSGYPVIQYEDVGLNLDFKPKVYPNKDVQVTMTIESKDEAAGPDPLTPIFTQRKIDGVARIPDGKTMMIASIAQDRETNGRTGLPLVGLIPILGRLFTA